MLYKVWIISEVYYPDEQGTAYFMTKLAEGFVRYFDVNVLCGYPTVTARGNSVPRKELCNGVRIERCRGTTFNKDVLALRLINLLTNSTSVLLKGIRKIKRRDVVLVVTGPHLLHFMVKLACLIRGAKYILRVDDVYPEALIAAGMLDRKSLTANVLTYINRVLYRTVDHVVVLGRDMEQLVLKKLGKSANDISIIPNWGDVDEVIPTSKRDNSLLKELGLIDKLVVQCAGNMGRAQGIENLFAAAELLRDDKNLHFLFIGSGAKREWMEKAIADRGLENVTLLNQRPRADQPNFLNACDIAVASLLPGMTGAGVPSRMYNIMAAGKPIIAVTSEDSEVALVVQEENIGWVVAPDKPEDLVKAIRQAQSNTERLQEMGQRAYAAAREKYSREKIIDQYRDLIRSMDGA